MSYQQLQYRIISTFWSEGLKRRLAETGHRFTEQELLGLAFRYARSFEERLELLGLLADHAPSVAEQARRAIIWQRETLACFQTCGPTRSMS